MQRNWVFWCSVILATRSICGANTQTSDAGCVESYGWAYNSYGQSPCVVWASLQQQCSKERVFNLSALPPNNSYNGLNWNQADGLCQCSSVLYSLQSACASCQLRSYIPWSIWIANCPAIHMFPTEITPKTDVPSWAYSFDPTKDHSFNITAAQILATSVKVRYEKRAMTLATSGIIGAACTLVIVAGMGVFGFIWYRRRRRGLLDNTGQSKYSPLYAMHPGAARHDIEGDQDRDKLTGIRLTLMTTSSIDLEKRANESLVSIPNNLYLPSPAESNAYSPAAESSHACTTPGRENSAAIVAEGNEMTPTNSVALLRQQEGQVNK